MDEDAVVGTAGDNCCCLVGEVRVGVGFGVALAVEAVLLDEAVDVDEVSFACFAAGVAVVDDETDVMGFPAFKVETAFEGVSLLCDSLRSFATSFFSFSTSGLDPLPSSVDFNGSESPVFGLLAVTLPPPCASAFAG